MTEERILSIDNRAYHVMVSQPIRRIPEAVRIVVPAYQPNLTAKKLLRVCIESIQSVTNDDEYELWVVDNCSPWENCRWLLDHPGINIALSRTKPLPPSKRFFYSPIAFWQHQEKWGSYANAVGLEIALKLVDSKCLRMLTLHMDTMACASNWLTFLNSQITRINKVTGACFEKHRTSDGVVHILGCMFDYQIFQSLNIHFWPDLPDYDVGDLVTIGFRNGGYTASACRNTYENPEYAESIKSTSPFRRIKVVRVFDDDDQVIFMHLGRGIPKADERYMGETASADEWIKFAKEHVIES